MQLELSDVKELRIKIPKTFVNRKCVEINWREQFLGESIFNDIPEDADAYHRNYFEYLERCWRDHVSIVVTPDILWHILMCEIGSLVKGDPEKYRHLFTEREDNQELKVEDAGIIMPLDQLTNMLEPLVPTDMSLFTPKFSTSNERSKHALLSAFCDTCSPYYEYSMLMCGFPAIDVRGELSDWEKMVKSWGTITDIMGLSAWFIEVTDILDTCIDRFSDREWWKMMFAIKRCGSGSQVFASGWLTEMFRIQPKVRFSGNFSSCISLVEYKQLDLQKDFRMSDGVFFSKYDKNFLVPEFAYTVTERLDKSIS